MGAEYKMRRSPRYEGDNGKQVLHPRFVSKGTLGTKEMLEYAQNTSSISSADMIGALDILARFTASQMRDGYTVHIEGIGYLSPLLKSRPVEKEAELRSESIHFKNVAFRCDKKLKQFLKNMPVYKESVPKLDQYDPEERRARLVWYLDQHGYITSPYYSALNHCSKYSARKDLEQFVKDGFLIRTGRRATTVYAKNEQTPLVTERFIPEE